MKSSLLILAASALSLAQTPLRLRYRNGWRDPIPPLTVESVIPPTQSVPPPPPWEPGLVLLSSACQR